MGFDRGEHPSQRLRYDEPRAVARHGLPRLSEAVAAGRRRSAACQWAEEQVLGAGRQRHRFSPRPHGAFRRHATDHASVFVRPDGGPAARNLRRSRLDGSHLPRGRRHYRASVRREGWRPEPCRGLAGRRRGRAARNLLTNPARAARNAHGFWFPREGLNEVTEIPLIAFYGDDFTGSTDAMECLAAAGLRTVLFTDVPSPSLLARFEGLQAMGIPGNSRGLTPDEMDGAILDALAALRRSGAAILHYKVCSTFDSSPTIGSFGRVMDLAKRLLHSGTIPIVVGAPKLGRYSMFGTLFARHNVDGTVHRIDRHPTMRCIRRRQCGKADMRLHIGAQTAQAITLLPAPAIAGSKEDAQTSLDRALTTKPDALVIDIADECAETQVGMLLQQIARDQTPLFVLGSSGVEYAMVAFWKAEGALPAQVSMTSPGTVDRLLVVSGSCSPVAAAQIAMARSDGFAEVALDPVALIVE